LLWRAYEIDQGHPAHRLLSGTTNLPLRAMPQCRNYRSENGALSAKEVAMTMQTSNPKQSGFFHSVAGQMTVTIAVMIAIILIAWRYVF
jgi:hypothetical protein